MEPREEIEISQSEFRNLLIFTMCADPAPHNVDFSKHLDFMNMVSKQFRFENWTEAYHAFV